jgi:hypothetical protein
MYIYLVAYYCVGNHVTCAVITYSAVYTTLIIWWGQEYKACSPEFAAILTGFDQLQSGLYTEYIRDIMFYVC